MFPWKGGGWGVHNKQISVRTGTISTWVLPLNKDQKQKPSIFACRKAIFVPNLLSYKQLPYPIFFSNRSSSPPPLKPYADEGVGGKTETMKINLYGNI